MAMSECGSDLYARLRLGRLDAWNGNIDTRAGHLEDGASDPPNQRNSKDWRCA